MNHSCFEFVLILETPKSTEDNFKKLWPLLNEAVNAIHLSKPVSISLEILYRHVENLCSEKKANLLYESLKQLCEEHIKSELPKLTKYPFFYSHFFHNTFEIHLVIFRIQFP